MHIQQEQMLTEEAIRAGLGTASIGHRVVFRQSVSSTNTLARELAEEGAPEGTLVLAEEQTAGRGRLGRRWLAPSGTSLLLSLVLRPQLPAAKAPQLTIISALAVRSAIGETVGLPAQLKWPNDILIHGRKVGGILIESSSLGAGLRYVIVGIGVNVNMPPQALPAHFHATSIGHELGRVVPRLALLQALLQQFEARYRDLSSGASPLSEWSEALVTLGQWVCISTPQGERRGLAVAVDEDGALLLRDEDGEIRRVLAGDVTTREH